MIILDTNVLSEALKPTPSEAVLMWLGVQERSTVFITTITQAELLYGLERLAPGKRRAGLLEAVERTLAEEFTGRILAFDEQAARAFAKIAAQRDAAGRPISQSDAMFAAIVKSRGASLATRDVSDFNGCGIRIVNPWTARAK